MTYAQFELFFAIFCVVLVIAGAWAFIVAWFSRDELLPPPSKDVER